MKARSPETLHELPCERQRRPRSLSCMAQTHSGPFLTGLCLASLLVRMEASLREHPEV
jgi:hypothetical protein